MANQLGPFPVEFGAVFPSGAFAAGGVEKVRDFDKSSGDRVVQQADKAHRAAAVGGRGDRRRPRGAAADGQGQGGRAVPAGAAGCPGRVPFAAVEFEGMTATPWVDASRCQGNGKDRCGARLAYSLKATGVRAPSRADAPQRARAQGRRLMARPPCPGAGAAGRPQAGVSFLRL